MRNLLPYVLIVLAALAGYWLLMSGGGEGGDSDLEAGSGDGAAGDAAHLKGSKRREAKGAKGRTAKGQRPSKIPKYVDPRTLPTGALVLRTVGPDLKPFAARHLRIYAWTKRALSRITKLPHYDDKAGTWRFPKLIAGGVDIRVSGDHVIEKRVSTVVKPDRENELTIHLEHAGAIGYEVKLYDKTRPKQVQLDLFGWDDKPTEGWFQARQPARLTTPKLTQSIALGAVGVVFGLAPGRYRLRVMSENEEWDDVQVDVKAGRTAAVSFQLRR